MAEKIATDLEWPEVVERLSPYVVKLATPRGFGTGFVLSMDPNSHLVVIATAAHVSDNAHYWEEPIRVSHFASGQTTLLRPPERAILLAEAIDTAALIFGKSKLEQLPADMLELPPEDHYLKVGYEVGWLGFPAIAASRLCFFTGRVSSWVQDEVSYLVDGVAINGVSGGPAFVKIGNSLHVIGVMSAYIPNRSTGESLPGLCVIRDVGQFQALAKEFKTLQEAKEQEKLPATPPPPPPEQHDPGGPTRASRSVSTAAGRTRG